MGRAMDEMVLRSMAKWPDVPDVYGWLMLDRRGNWKVRSKGDAQRFERIGNAAFREFIARNYQPDARGCWFFQNGPQRVFVKLAYTPLVVHHVGESLIDQCGRAFSAREFALDEEGSVLAIGEAAGGSAVALVDDRDIARYEPRAGEMGRLTREEAARRFGFVADPGPPAGETGEICRV